LLYLRVAERARAQTIVVSHEIHPPTATRQTETLLPI
jgi:hypothetical protein